MTDYATYEDVLERWPSLPSTQYDQADVLCGDASLILRAQYPDLDSQVATDADLAQRALVVVCNMVKRAMMAVTPGVAQESVGTGPYSHSLTYTNPSGNLYTTAAEDAMIRGYQPRAAAFDVSPDVY